MSLKPEAHGPGYNDTELCLRSIAISLKRIADALERPAARDNAPIGNRGEPIMPGPRGWEVKS
jgi:hypothetical protein